MAKNKFGPYIQKLMTPIIDKEVDEFVKELAFSELTRLNVNIEEILVNYTKESTDTVEESNKQLLQEDKENVTNK